MEQLTDNNKLTKGWVNMVVYIVFGYDSLLDSEEIKAVFLDINMAEDFCNNQKHFRIEEHEVIK